MKDCLSNIRILHGLCHSGKLFNVKNVGLIKKRFVPPLGDIIWFMKAIKYST